MSRQNYSSTRTRLHSPMRDIGDNMAFLITKCRECGTDCAVFDNGDIMSCKCGLSPNVNPSKREFKRPQLIEDESNE